MNSSGKSLRQIRPLTSRISALRNHLLNSTDYQSCFVYNGEKNINKDLKNHRESNADSSFDHSLVLEDHILPYSRTKINYKKSKSHTSILHQQDSDKDDDDYQDDDETTISNAIEIPHSNEPLYTEDEWKSWGKKLASEEWILLNDVFEAFMALVSSHFDSVQCHYNKLKLTDICAIETGISIGLNSNLQCSSVEESKILESETFKQQWYDHRIVGQYSHWIIVGHSIGIIFANLDNLNNIILYVVKWSAQYGLHKIMLELYIENIETDLFYSNYIHIRDFCSVQLQIDYDSIVMKYLGCKLDLHHTLENSDTIARLIDLNHKERYTACLSIISKIIQLNCEHLSQLPKLVEDLHHLNQNQRAIINSLSKFIQVLRPDHDKFNQKLINKVYEFLRIGNFRSLIPVLKFIKLYINNKPQVLILQQYGKQSKAAKRIIKDIFRQSHFHNKRFVDLINPPQLQQHSGTVSIVSSRAPFKRSKVSTGDLI
jgi:hypothetical protein